MIDYGLDRKTALVTGGSHGIGLAIAKKLIDEGVQVYILSRNPRKAMSHLGAINYNPMIQCDVTCRDQIDETLEELVELFSGGLNILVNNVGGGGRSGLDPHTTPVRVWEKVMDKNYLTAAILTSGLMGRLHTAGRISHARVITISSVYGKEAGGKPWFTAAKSAQIAMMKEFSRIRDYALANITFNTVCPGPIDIPDTGWDTNSLERIGMENKIPLGRLGTPEEVADLVLFLCSRQSSYVNGASIPVDGGLSRSF